MAAKEAWKPSQATYNKLVLAYFAYAIAAGYLAAIQPTWEWRFFSWHPFLMTSGMVGLMGIAAVTKKMGGYTNTKNHGLIANGGLFMAVLGLYMIFKNKENNGSDHFTTPHGQFGLAVVLSSVGAGMAGGIFLHPDFGVAKTNKTIRFAHKMMARGVVAMSWVTAMFGLCQLTTDPLVVGAVGLPLLILAPFTLI